MDFKKWILILVITVIFTNVSSRKYRRNKKHSKELTCECGTSSLVPNLENTIGSSEKYPWVVTLMDRRNMTTFCVGTVISRSLILTSASCLMETRGNNEEDKCSSSKNVHTSCFKSRLDIAIGFPIITEALGILSRGGAYVKKIIPYSDFEEDNLMADLVLLRMFPSFNCEDIPPVCLGSHKLVKTWNTGIISGWKTEYFKNESLNVTGVQMTTVHGNNCTKIQGHRASKQAIMCPSKNESASYCKGYAGAPFVIPVKHRFHLVGVMSKAIVDEDCEKHEIYPLICIQNYLSWIRRQIKKEENIHFRKRFSNHL